MFWGSLRGFLLENLLWFLRVLEEYEWCLKKGLEKLCE